jgi:hypothetical protein
MLLPVAMGIGSAIATVENARTVDKARIASENFFILHLLKFIRQFKFQPVGEPGGNRG